MIHPTEIRHADVVPEATLNVNRVCPDDVVAQVESKVLFLLQVSASIGGKSQTEMQASSD